eukprot:NODE_523_length_763_cov_505.229560_g514_i0.p1 GENE.NODE_523_length_763_cov_505.229560_g514_i0~~NODE_523_length_763_cov_505.229560_g514_i0.p1  ORF type:complete len:124 (+),score=28.38 NODE_523_length_763_cov_505.229560_g514_i0:49-372(+)
MYTQQIQPFADNVLVTPLEEGDAWYSGYHVVAATGPSATLSRAGITEGTIVRIGPGCEAINLNWASNYQLCPFSAINGKVTSRNWGANRAYRYTSQIRLPLQAPLRR